MPSRSDALREAIARTSLAGAKKVANQLGQHVTPANFHSTIPDLPPEDHPIWERRSGSLPVDTAAQIAFVESDLARYTGGEFEEATAPAKRHGFRYWNGLFETADAELLYALLRHIRPKRVLELGSGFSTMITGAALARNAQDGSPAEFTAVDPEPRTEVADAIAGVGTFERRDARDLTVDSYAALQAGDVLFIDTSHIVKLGSEVNQLFLEVLPTLAPGVWVQVHDIFLPYEYPRYRLVASGFFNEQYLLHAFLLGNDAWETRLALHAMAREQRERLTAVVPSLGETTLAEYSPSSFWIRRRA